MAEENKKVQNLADIWGDTVDLKHLAYAMIIGIVLGFCFFSGGN